MSGAVANILERKLAASANRRTQASLQNSLVLNIEKTISKVFLDLLKSDIQARVSEQVVDTHLRTIDAMSSALFGALPFGDYIGLVGFDAQFIDTAISLATGGTKTQDGDRPITKTDAAISRRIFNRVLSDVFGKLSLNGNETIGITEFETEKAPLAFLLSEQKYALLRIDIAETAPTSLGQIELVIPLSCIMRISAQEHQLVSESEHESWQAAMARIADIAPIELDTIVQRMHMSLGEILGLKKGGFLELPQGSLENLSLEGRTQNANITIFRGHLGALKTQKAFKVTRVVSDDNFQF